MSSLFYNFAVYPLDMSIMRIKEGEDAVNAPIWVGYY